MIPTITTNQTKLPEKSAFLNVEHCGYEQCSSGHSFGPAVRTHYLIHFVCSGRGIFTRGGTTYALSAGEGFLIVPGDTTYYRADDADPWEYYWIGFSGVEAELILKNLGLSAAQPIFRCDLSAVEYLRRCCEPPAIPGRELMLTGNACLFFAAVADSMGYAEADSPSSNCVGMAMRFIHDNYSHDITVENIARHVGVSRSHLFRTFKEANGISVQRYLLEYRLKTAARMLKDPSHNISEVSYSCGFTDPNHFARAFKSFYGVSPSQFRALRPDGAVHGDCGDSVCV